MHFRLLVAAIGLFAASSQLYAQFDFRYDTGERRWLLRNELVEASLVLGPDGRFEFERLRSVRDTDQWVALPTISPISLTVDGEEFGRATTYRLVTQTQRPLPRNGRRLTIVLDDLNRKGRFLLDVDMYANQPVLRFSYRFRNIQSKTVRLTDNSVLPFMFQDQGRAYRFFRVDQWWGAGVGGNFATSAELLDADTAGVVYSGSYGQQCSWFAIRDGRDRGLFAGWEFDGRAYANVSHDKDLKAIRMQVDLEELSRPLAPNADFASPAGFVGLFHGDWEEAGYVTQRFVEAAVAPEPIDSAFPYVVWDSWGYDLFLDEFKLRQNAQIAARLGIELFVIDLGWARHIGDWFADPKKFPSGMRAFSDYVHSLGMKFGLHFALAEADAASPILLQNPDWRSSTNYHYFGADSLCLSHQPVREWLVNQTLRMIDDFNVDWILQDGENMVKECRKTTHTHDPGDSNYSNAVDGLNWVVDQVRRQRPRVEWENCEDGGNMMTFSMARRYVTSINADNSGPMTTRQAVYGASYPFPTRYLDRYMGDTQLNNYITRSYMFGGPLIFMNRLTDMRAQDQQLAASEIILYKQMRARIREGKVYHLTPRPAPGRVDAIESFHPPTGSAIVFVYRPPGAPEIRTLRVRGLDRNRTYRVRQADSRITSTITGAALLDQGVEVQLPAAETAQIIFLDPEF